jgi:hypothetical protein
VVALAAASCGPDFHVLGDPSVPIDLELATGVPRTRVAGPAGVAPAVVDTGSPLSALAVPEVGCDAATMLALRSASAPDRLRLGLPDLHPACLATGSSVVGGDLLARFETVFAGDLMGCPDPLGCLQLFSQEVESTRQLAQRGYAVLPFLLLGGGKRIDERGRTLTYTATRVPLRACLDPPATWSASTPAAALGLDATLLVATGVAPLVLSAASSTRMGRPPAGPGAPITLPGGDAATATAIGPTLARLALVGQTLSQSRDPGACADLQRSRCLNQSPPPPAGFCDALVLPEDARDNDSDAEPYVMFEGPLDVAILADDVPYVVAAREEVRPRLADVDGLLGATLLRRLLELRIDYPGVPGDDLDSGPKVIARCPPPAAPPAPQPSCTVQVRHPK